MGWKRKVGLRFASRKFVNCFGAPRFSIRFFKGKHTNYYFVPGDWLCFRAFVPVNLVSPFWFLYFLVVVVALCLVPSSRGPKSSIQIDRAVDHTLVSLKFG